MNVAVGDLAILVKPHFKENQDRICLVVDVLADNDSGRWWYCTFTTPVNTVFGPQLWACLNDDQLRKLTGPGVLEFKEDRLPILLPA